MSTVVLHVCVLLHKRIVAIVEVQVVVHKMKKIWSVCWQCNFYYHLNILKHK